MDNDGGNNLFYLALMSIQSSIGLFDPSIFIR